MSMDKIDRKCRSGKRYKYFFIPLPHLIFEFTNTISSATEAITAKTESYLNQFSTMAFSIVLPLKLLTHSAAIINTGQTKKAASAGPTVHSAAENTLQ